MSRVGKKPIPIPDTVEVTSEGSTLTVASKKGSGKVLTRSIHPAVNVEKADGVLHVVPVKTDKPSKAIQGLTRSLVANMIHGIDKGFERVLEINGIGYRVSISGNTLALTLGYSHPVNFEVPDGVTASVDKNVIKLSGFDKELLGQTAAKIRDLRPPEPYKGKGIKYAEEHIRRKAGKTGTK